MVDSSELLFEIKILGVPVKINLVNYSDEDEAVYGQYDPDTYTIELNAASSPLHQRLTLIHEILHVCEDLLGLSNLEHKDIYAISQTAYSISDSNPHLTEWFLQLKK